MAEKGKGKNVLLSLGMIALIAFGPYFVTKLIGGGDRETEEISYTATAWGDSKAFEIEPIEGIRISAGENVLDRDREFTLDFADESTYDKVSQHLAKKYGVKPLLALELDAGLQPDEAFPGNFQLSFNLKEMGIPEDLYEDVRVFRSIESNREIVSYEFSKEVSPSGVLTIQSNQNCCIYVAIGTGLVFYGLYKFVHSVQEAFVRWYFTNEPTGVAIPIDDPYGDFTLYFRFRDTENPEGFQAYFENEKKAMAILDRLEAEVDAEIERSANKMATGQENLAWWDRVRYKKERDAARATINRAALLKKKRMQNEELRKLNEDPVGQLPFSIQYAIEAIKESNKFLSLNQHLNKLNFRMDIFLVGPDAIGADGGRAVKRVLGDALLLVNYTKNMVVNHIFNDEVEGAQSSVISIVHELFHARQQTNYCSVKMGMIAAESTAAALEKDAARYFYQHNVLPVSPDSRKGQRYEFSPRGVIYAFGKPLDKIAVSDKYRLSDLLHPSRFWDKTWAELKDASDLGYTLAYVIEAMRESVGKPDLPMEPLMSAYSKWGGTFSTWLKKGIGMTDQQFDRGWKHFAEKNLKGIYYAQLDKSVQDKADLVFKDCWTTDVDLDIFHSVKEIEVPREDYCIRTWYVNSTEKSRMPFNLFIETGDKEEPSPYVFPYIVTNFEKQTVENPDPVLVPLESSYYNNEAKDQYNVAMAVTSYKSNDPVKKRKFYLVAFYQPWGFYLKEQKGDTLTIELCHPQEELLERGWVSGCELTYTNNKSVDDKGFAMKVLDIPIDEWKETIEWIVPGSGKKGNEYTVSMHWYYNKTRNRRYLSPETDPVRKKVEEEEEEPEVIIFPEETITETEDPVPEGGYWKLVRVEVDNSEAYKVYKSNDRVSYCKISGSDGKYIVYYEMSDHRVWKRDISIEVPKKYYKVDEMISLEVVCDKLYDSNPDEEDYDWSMPSGSIAVNPVKEDGTADIGQMTHTEYEQRAYMDTGRAVSREVGRLYYDDYLHKYGIVIRSYVGGRLDAKLITNYYYEFVPAK